MDSWEDASRDPPIVRLLVGGGVTDEL
jgi:hypothetical protein